MCNPCASKLFGLNPGAPAWRTESRIKTSEVASNESGRFLSISTRDSSSEGALKILPSAASRTYHDFAFDSCSSGESDEMRKHVRANTASFPSILQSMLDQADARGFSDIVSWQSHGRAFHVHDHERFTHLVMPLFFRQSKYTSFQRQLSLYGFVRLTRKGPDQFAYFHERCLRGLPTFASQIKRIRVNGHRVRQSASPDSEPDFFSMPSVEEARSLTNILQDSDVSDVCLNNKAHQMDIPALQESQRLTSNHQAEHEATAIGTMIRAQDSVQDTPSAMLPTEILSFPTLANCIDGDCAMMEDESAVRKAADDIVSGDDTAMDLLKLMTEVEILDFSAEFDASYTGANTDKSLLDSVYRSFEAI